MITPTMRPCRSKIPSICKYIVLELDFLWFPPQLQHFILGSDRFNTLRHDSIYKATARSPANAAARPISSLPAAPVDSGMRPVDVLDAPPAPVAEGLKEVGTVALPDG